MITVPGATRPPTLTRRRPTRPLNGARITVSLRRDRADGHARLVGRVGRLDLFDLLVGEHLGGVQLAAALELARALGERGIGHREVGTRLLAVEFDQHLALAHLLAFGRSGSP